MPSFSAEMLEQDRHQVRDQDDRQQRVAELRAAGQVGRPVAGVHVADRDQKARAGERQHLAPGRRARRHRDGAMDLWQRGLARGFPPGEAVGISMLEAPSA